MPDDATHTPSHHRQLRRRWLRYSLRSLLAAITLGCVLLGLWVHGAERQRKAVAAIRDLGGRAYYSSEWRDGTWLDAGASSWWVRFFRESAGPDYAERVVGVYLYGARVEDNDVRFLRDLPHLKFLNIGGADISDPALDHFVELRKLESLVLSRTEVTDQGLLQHLPQMESLKEVSLDKYKVSKQSADRLCMLMPRTTITHD